MNDVLHISIQKNAVYSSIPRIANIIVSLITGFVSDWMHVHGGLSLTTVRKTFAALCIYIFNLIFFLNKRFALILIFISASIIPSIFAISASYAGCDELLVVTLLTISIAAQGFNTAGTVLNIFDLGPNYIAPLNSIVNSVSSIAAFLAPNIVGILTPNVRSNASDLYLFQL